MDRKELARRQREERRALVQRLRERRTRRSNILYEPIPEIDVPILRPTAPVISKSKSLSKVEEPIREEIDDLVEWVDNIVVVPRRRVNRRVERLKKKVNEIFERYKAQSKRTPNSVGRNIKNSPNRGSRGTRSEDIHERCKTWSNRAHK